MYNKLILVGRLGKDAESRGTEGNVVAINIATTNYYKKKTGEAVNEVEWTSCLAFGKLGELLLSQGKKGDLVVVEGKKKTNTYEDKNGQTKTNVYMMVDNFQRLSWIQETKPAGEEKPTEEKNIFQTTKLLLTPIGPSMTDN